jgi:hypothetical protein
MRYAIARAEITLFKIEGTSNPANSLTKPLSAEKLNEEAKAYQLDVHQ